MQSSWSVLAEILLSRVCMLLEERPRWWKPVRVWCEVILRTVIRYKYFKYPDIVINVSHLRSWTLFANTSLSHSEDLALLE